MDGDASGSSWRFAQCFGDKGEVDDITEGDGIIFPLELMRQNPDALSIYLI